VRFAAPKECSCGSGLHRRAIYDARSIFLTYACEKCERTKLSGYRRDIFTNPNYDHDEPIDEE
jgi:hypothetical protein